MRRRSMPPGLIIILCFLCVIGLGSLLLSFPFAQTGAVRLSYLDVLFTATSATCVTGLTVASTAEAFSGFGQAVLLCLIQIGGLGAAALGILVTMAVRRHISLKDAVLLKESWNIVSLSDLYHLIRRVLLLTISFEAVGAALSLCFFARHMPFGRAVWVSIFHSVSAFNNAGFDLVGPNSLTVYGDAPMLNLVTIGLILFSGLGYLVLIDLITPHHGFRQFSLQSKVVLCTTGFLLVGGTLLLRLTEHISWMGALFQSVTCRTAGFCTWDLTQFSPAGLMVMCLLMFVGASPGSTGGGTKTTTLFALLLALRSAATGRPAQAFRRRVPDELISRAFVVSFSGALVLFVCTLLLSVLNPALDFMTVLFESVSAFSTCGLSLSATPLLTSASHSILIVTMFIGRVGPLTIATLWAYRCTPAFRYTEESFTIG